MTVLGDWKGISVCSKGRGTEPAKDLCIFINGQKLPSF